MSDQQVVQTKEIARNPHPNVMISCTVCKQEYPLERVLHERQMPPPYETVTEGYLRCPSCKDEKHSYYMTELLRFKQVELKKALEGWNLTSRKREWRNYSVLQDRFKTMFDQAQKKYLALFEKETAK